MTPAGPGLGWPEDRQARDLVVDPSGIAEDVDLPIGDESGAKRPSVMEQAQTVVEPVTDRISRAKYFVGRHRRTREVRGQEKVAEGRTRPQSAAAVDSAVGPEVADGGREANRPLSGNIEKEGIAGVRGVSGSGPGLGWPRTDFGDPAASAMGVGWPPIVAQAERVSRETAQSPDRSGFAVPAVEVAAGPDEGGGARGDLRRSDGRFGYREDSVHRPAADPYARAVDDLEGREQSPAVPRHGRPVGWYSSGANELTNQEAAEFVAPESESANPDSIAAAERSVDGWPTPLVSDGPMIAGRYFGAERAQVESEDEVAIPVAPDASADTPIARAAQAAMKARSVSGPWPRPGSCRILTIANQKGGVGKTTTAVNLAASLAMHGSRVLVVDLDPQGNASTALDVEHRSGTQSIYNVLVDGRPLADVIKPVQGFTHLQCAPATIDLAGAEIELVPLVARESRLSRAVTEYDASNLDYIFIDCPPSLGLLTVNALVAAPEVLIPIQCEYYALEGLEQLIRTVELVRNHLNPKLMVSTILLTMFDSRTRLASQVADEVRSHFGDQVLQSVIPRSVRVSEAPSYGQSVMTYDPGSSGALAYLEAAKEMAFKNTAAATA
jgi:chromosome partitioning protein